MKLKFRDGLSHMLVILVNRHEDSLFSKINKLASPTNSNRRNQEPKRSGHAGLRKTNRDESRKIERYPQPYACHFVCTLHEDSQFSKIIVASPDENHAGKRASSEIHLLLEGGVGNDRERPSAWLR